MSFPCEGGELVEALVLGRSIDPTYRLEEHSSGGITEPDILGLQRDQQKGASGDSRIWRTYGTAQKFR